MIIIHRDIIYKPAGIFAVTSTSEHAQIRENISQNLIIMTNPGELKFSQFCSFMDNLQTEVLHMEFGEFSKGAATISELDFAR